jgi:hypothetical protein
MHLARVADVAAPIIYSCNFHSTSHKSLYPKSLYNTVSYFQPSLIFTSKAYEPTFKIESQGYTA